MACQADAHGNVTRYAWCGASAFDSRDQVVESTDSKETRRLTS